MDIICGVDVSKGWLDAHIEPGGELGRFANDAEGIAGLAGFCRRRQVELVVMEATGGYERQAFVLLWEHEVACAIVNPRNVRLYAQAMGMPEKTDRLDAGQIARFAVHKGIKPMPLPGPTQRRIKALAARLRQVTGDLTVQKQRRASLLDTPSMLASLEEVIALLKRQSVELADEIARLIEGDPLWAELTHSFRQTKGLAGRTMAYLAAELPEIGSYSNRAIAKLSGLAPIADDSGKRQGHRSIRGGRAGIRSTLYLVAAIVARYDKSLAAFRDRLIATGKPKMVVRIALARKLLVRLNAKARDIRANFQTQTA